MTYNIIKKMKKLDGKSMFVLLTDGLSQIMEIDEKSKAINFINILNENSDNGCVYKLKEVCDLKK
jgi:hypothetical protein